MPASVPPQTYLQGLKGGKGKDIFGKLQEGGFGDGGALYCENGKIYYGGGGGFSGGSTRFREAGGGGSFSIDKNATFDHVCVEYGKCKIEFIN